MKDALRNVHDRETLPVVWNILLLQIRRYKTKLILVLQKREIQFHVATNMQDSYSNNAR